jgi:hypothetical protein
MSLKRFTAYVIAIGLLQLFVSIAAFGLAPEMGSAYLMLLRNPQSQAPALPVLTESVSLPLLRVRPPDPHDRPVTAPWVAIVWGVVLVLPGLSALSVIRATDVAQALPRYVLLQSLWFTTMALLVSFVVGGLALALACM